MSWLLSIFSSIWKPLAAGIAGLFVILFQRWRIKRQAATIDQQEQVIKVHEKIQDTHRQDVKTDAEVESKVNELEKKVSHAENSEKAAGEVSGALDGYFTDGGRK